MRGVLRGWGEELETRAYTKASDIGLSRQVPLASSRNTRQAEEEDGKTLLCDKRDRAITYVFCREFLSSFNIYVFICKKICLKESEVWRKVISNKIIVMLVTQRLPSFCVSSPILWQMTVMNRRIF